MTAEQAGIYRLVLYENKDLGVVYNQDGSVQSLSNSGDVIEIENSDENTVGLGMTLTPKKSANNKLKYKHSITWSQFGLDNSDVINTLKCSIYGWIPEIEFYNNKKSVLLNPIKFIESSINNNVSNSYEIALDNVNFGNRISDLIEQFNYVFEDTNNYVFEDTNNFIFD